MSAPGFRTTMALASRGVPVEVAARWSDARRVAALVAIGEYEGGTFDWRKMAWEHP